MSTPDTAEQALSDGISTRLRAAARQLRVKPIPLADYIPLLLLAADALDSAADRALRALLVDHIECAACGRYFSCEVCGSQDAEIVPAAPLLPQRKPHDHEPAAGFS